jgi:hypothetical protein
MTPREYLGAVVAISCLAVLGLASVPAGAAGTHSQWNPDGVVSVTPSVVAPGQTIDVSGDHFPPGIDVNTQICGDNNLAGSADCVLDDTGLGTVTSQGKFTTSITVAIPPVPCPCVAIVTSNTFSTVLSPTPTAPVVIIGAPVSPLRPPTSAATVNEPLRILNAQLNGNGPWSSWFGGFAHRTLSLTVHNPNQGVYPHPSLVLVAGKSGNALSTVSTSPLPSMSPGETTTIHVNVAFPPFSFGDNEVLGTVGDAGLKEHFKVTTTIVPWGLIVIALIILQFILLAIRNALRRRNERRDGTVPPPGPVAEGPSTPPDSDSAHTGSEPQPEEVGAF